MTFDVDSELISKRLFQSRVIHFIETMFLNQFVYLSTFIKLTNMKFNFKMSVISGVDFNIVFGLILVCQVTHKTILLLILIQHWI